VVGDFRESRFDGAASERVGAFVALLFFLATFLFLNALPTAAVFYDFSYPRRETASGGAERFRKVAEFEVRVRVDEGGQDRGAAQIGDGSHRRFTWIGNDRRDPPAVDDHDSAGNRRPGDRENVSRPQSDRAMRRVPVCGRHRVVARAGWWSSAVCSASSAYG
jgi:hypothetical protein